MSSRGSPRILNVNVGVLGHVDCGKTSLVAALSTNLSTAALDKHPQSKERGITLDLGFSSFKLPVPEDLAHLPYDEIQFTLVDCPGHASLIRTIIGGVQIIDMAILVVDVNKGIQAQTAECLVVGEVTTSTMVVALNKIDLLPAESAPKLIRKAYKRLMQTFDLTKFAGVHVVPVCARPDAIQGLEELKTLLLSCVHRLQPRKVDGPLLFSVDHCFPIKGQGTVLTGTVLQGTVKVGSTIELPEQRLQRTVKSMQMFHKPVNQAMAGDRLGICVSQLDPKIMERGLVSAPGVVPTTYGGIARVDRIRFYAGQIMSKAKYHVSIGHFTVMAQPYFFGLPDGHGVSKAEGLQMMVDSLHRMTLTDGVDEFDFGKEYLYQEELYGLDGRRLNSAGSCDEGSGVGPRGGRESGGEGGEAEAHFGPQWVLLQFEQPVTVPPNSLLIGAKLDLDIHGESCRLAFYGRMLAAVDTREAREKQRLRVYKVKQKQGVIERIQADGCSAICKNMFKKETDLSAFFGAKVITANGEVGEITRGFGKAGKFVVEFASPLTLEGRQPVDNMIYLRYKRYVFDDKTSKLCQ